MNKIQARLVQLLNEIDQFAKEQNVMYALFERTAYQAYTSHHFDRQSYILDVCMTAEGAAAFKKYVEAGKVPGREIECWLDNPKMPAMYLRYVDSTTTLLDTSIEPLYRKIGICVQIRILRSASLSGDAGKKEKRLELLGTEKGLGKDLKKQLKAMPKLYLSGRGKSARTVWDAVMGMAPGKEYVYHVPKGNDRHFPLTMFRDLATMEFEGGQYPVPNDMEQFLEIRYGKDWKKSVPKTKEKQDKFEVVADTEVPYAEYVEYAQSQGFVPAELIKIRRRYVRWRHLHLKKYDTVTKHDWWYVKRTAQRIEMWEDMFPIKDQILAMRDEEKWDELEETLKPLLTKFEFWKKKSMGFSFDNEITEAAFDLLRHQGKDSYVKELDALIPAVHRQNMKEYLEEEGIDTSYVYKKQRLEGRPVI